MNKTQLYEKIATILISKPLRTYKDRKESVKCAREVVLIIEDYLSKKITMQRPL